MPDITMCANTACKMRLDCYRYLAYPTPGRQSYAYYEDGPGCMSWTQVPEGVEARHHDLVDLRWEVQDLREEVKKLGAKY